MDKNCNICKSIKPISDFYKNQSRCKECTKQYALENKQRIQEYKKNYRINNIDSVTESNKRYYDENKERINSRNAEYYYKNREMVMDIQKKYREDNKEILSIKNPQYSKKYKDSKKNDTLYQLTQSIRSHIGYSLRDMLINENKPYKKSKSTNEILYYTNIIC